MTIIEITHKAIPMTPENEEARFKRLAEQESVFGGDEPGEGSEVTTADLVDEPAIVIDGDASL